MLLEGSLWFVRAIGCNTKPWHFTSHKFPATAISEACRLLGNELNFQETWRL